MKYLVTTMLIVFCCIGLIGCLNGREGNAKHTTSANEDLQEQSANSADAKQSSIPSPSASKEQHISAEDNSVEQNIVYLADFGVKANSNADQTTKIQQAFKASAERGQKLIINKGTYLIKGTGEEDNKQFLYDRGGIKVYANSNIEFQDGAIFKVIPNSFTAYNCLRIWNVDNVKITGGKLIGDRKTHKGTTGEWGYGIMIAGSSNISISNMILTEFWGDGIDLNCANLKSGAKEGLKVNTNVDINGIQSIFNRRQGLSLEAGKNIKIRNSSFINNRGTNPQGGIDIEPWSEEYDNVENVFIENCYFKDNPQGILVNFPNLRNINIVSCKFEASNKTTVNYHLWQLFGDNEMAVSNCSFDRNAINVLINSGRQSNFANCTFNNTFRIDAPQPSNVHINRSSFSGGSIVVENRSDGKLRVEGTKFVNNSKIDLRGKINSTIVNNSLSDADDVLISDLSAGKSVIQNNTLKGSKYQAITTVGNAVIEGNKSSESEVFVQIRKDAANIDIRNNTIATQSGKMLTIQESPTIRQLRVNLNRTTNKMIIADEPEMNILKSKGNTLGK